VTRHRGIAGAPAEGSRETYIHLIYRGAGRKQDVYDVKVFVGAGHNQCCGAVVLPTGHGVGLQEKAHIS
jgi:hypothetical protein